MDFEKKIKKEEEVEGKELVTDHLIKGAWAPKTMKGYSSAVSKFKSYIESLDRVFSYEEPMKVEDVYGFVVWAGASEAEKGVAPSKELKAKTIAKYLAGLRAWHMAKHHEEPKLDKQMVDWLLKSTERAEERRSLMREEVKIEKKPITVKKLFEMVVGLHGESEAHDLATVIALVAFWGMARLGEILRETAEEGAIKVEDLSFETGNKGKVAVLRLWKAKTAKPGTAQTIRLAEQHSVLDPVAALERLLRKAHPKKSKSDLLFTYLEEGNRVTLTKARFTKLMEGVWGKVGVREGEWSGHSFRVGGASLKYNLGWEKERIMIDGRWKSGAVESYLKEYSKEEKEETKEFMWLIDRRNGLKN
ncbi:hypothetical protein DFH28DRAFT_916395 [Melampsora americana]|nr:hypothetical protein DFH28DRAFT_916395 [Melampsora americana]